MIDFDTDKPFGEEDDGEGFDMQSLFTIDGDAIQAAFKFDESALTSGLSGMSLDLSGLSLDMGSLPAFDGSSIAIDPSSIDMSNLVDFSDIKLDLGDVQPTMDSAKMQAAMEDIMAEERLESSSFCLMVLPEEDVKDRLTNSRITMEKNPIITFLISVSPYLA